MADEQEDPPIGTAQNAADVARKAELEGANKSESDLEGKLPWDREHITRVFDQVQEFASGPDGQWLEADFIEALEILHGIRSR
mgnify:CR=1 FL=1